MLEVIDHSLHCHPLNTFVLVNVLDEPFMHEKDVRPAADIRMDRHWEDEFIVLAVEIVEVILMAPD